MSQSRGRIENATVEAPEGLVARVWARDAGAWGPGDDDPGDRLGWLDLPATMAAHLDDIAAFARDVEADGLDTVALLGMGGSSLAPEVFGALLGGRARLEVCDSTHPDRVRAQTEALDLDRTLFVVSSKSGGTVETMSLYQHFRSLCDDGSRFVAITDPGTSLEGLASHASFRRTFSNPPDVGGRFSALSLFGLVPAALLGVDVGSLLEGGRAMAAACRAEADSNPGAWLGAALASLARAGRDKLTFLLPERWLPFGDWIEQLIAESTGKRGVGITPVVREPGAPPDRYGSDRVFVHVRVAEEEAGDDSARALSEAGHPVVTMDVAGAGELGAEMFRWEFATAVAGALMGVNAFDQPDVEAAKRAGRAALAAGEETSWPADDPGPLFDGIAPNELACILAFAPQTSAAAEVVAAARARLVGDRGVATSAGFGPRYLHSTGQLHKGGPRGVRALVVLDVPRDDVPIPGSQHGFARLVRAQAEGDAAALEGAGRRVARTNWDVFEGWAVP